MKARTAKRSSVPTKDARPKKHPAARATNTALNQQNRRVLAQHYRAKYGVK
jgi:hypothetical protein